MHGGHEGADQQRERRHGDRILQASSSSDGKYRFVVGKLLGFRKMIVCSIRVWMRVEAARAMTTSGSYLVGADRQ
ncbi:uncharacterized protein A4U43_C08F22740 [Asparagus officinalis]|nr:uncharacterized protein A4U43_C08F22740 [Asparagus officinalis]